MERRIPGQYEHVVGDSCHWFIPTDRNPNRIFVVIDGCKEGFYGDTVVLQMVDGSEQTLIGPYNSHKEAFERDTGKTF